MPVSNSEAKSWGRQVVRGLWTSPMIPMLEDGAIDHVGIRANVDHILSLGAGGVGFGFSSASYPPLAERIESLKALYEAVDRRVPCYDHALDYSVPETIDLVRYCSELGADAV